MAPTILCLSILFAIFATGRTESAEFDLPDVNITYISNPYFGRSIGIPKFFFDTLESCHVTFPDGAEYEAYPNASIPYENVCFVKVVQPFTSCAIGFSGIGEEFSGTYQLASKVLHFMDQSQSLTRQRFNLQVIVKET